MLEARDLLFARLLQYRAYKKAAELLAGLELLETRYIPRQVALEARYVSALPEVVLGVTPDQLATLAAEIRKPKPPPVVAVDHVHAPRVDVRAHARAVVERLQMLGTATFTVLCSGCTETIELVARFLALLELGREGRVSFDQPTPFGEFTVTWVPPRADEEDAGYGHGEADDPAAGGDGYDGEAVPAERAVAAEQAVTNDAGNA